MSKTKSKMNQQIDEMLAALRSFNLPVFEDEVAEDEQEKFKKDGHHFFVYSTGDMVVKNDGKSIVQDIAVFYYSENLDNLDERIVDIIQAIPNNNLFRLERTSKQRLQRKDTDGYVDRVVIMYNRIIVMQGCVLR